MNAHNLAELVVQAAQRFGPHEAFVMGDRSISYAGLDAASSRVAAYLQTRGVGKNSHVAILSENRLAWGVVFFSIMKAGATAVCMDPLLTVAEMQSILDHSEASYVFASGSISHALQKLAEPPSKLKAILPMNLSDGLEDEKYFAPAIADEDIAILAYTSGTIGSQKGVMLSHKSVMANVISAFKRVPHAEGCVFLSLLPLSHMFGITAGFIGPMLNGGKVVYVPSLKNYEILNAMRKNKPRVMVVVPLMLRILKSHIEEKIRQRGPVTGRLFRLLCKLSLFLNRLGIHAGKILFRKIHRSFGDRWGYSISGGAPLECETEEFFNLLGIPVLAGYGLTETAPIVSVCSLKQRKPGTVGRPLDGIQIRISSEGEIHVSGPCVMSGYFKSRQVTESVLRDGWFHTGDIGEIDIDGYLTIRGRKKNVIVTSSGLKIFPEEVEDRIGKCPSIGEVCVLGKRTGLGEQPYAVVVPAYTRLQGVPKDEIFDQIRAEIQACQKDVMPQKKISAFEIWEAELPKTTTKKIRRQVIAQMLAEGESPRANSPMRACMDPFANKLRSLIARAAAIDESRITLKASLSTDLGIDSLMKLEVIAQVDRELGICIPDECVYKIDTFEQLVSVARSFREAPAAIRGDGLFSEESGDIADLIHESFLFRCTRFVSYLLLKFIASVYFRMKIRNREALPQSGSFVMVSNHSSLIDFPLIYAALPSGVVKNTAAPAAKDFFFENPLFALAVQAAFNAFPLERYGNFLKGLKTCARLIKAGKSLVLFPEGTRSTDGSLLPFKPGLGMLSFELNVPIVPVYVKGSGRALPKGSLLPRPCCIELAFADPVQPEHFHALKGSTGNYEIYQQIADEARKRIQAIKEAV
jgi:long-chain acyl-CoA synthetase